MYTKVTGIYLFSPEFSEKFYFGIRLSFRPCKKYPLQEIYAFERNKDDSILKSSTKNSLKSLKIHNPPPTPGISTPATIKNGLIIKF